MGATIMEAAEGRFDHRALEACSRTTSTPSTPRVTRATTPTPGETWLQSSAWAERTAAATAASLRRETMTEKR